MPEPTIKELVSLVKAAAAEAANYQQRFAAEDTEARKIVDIMESYLRASGRLVYGGAAINAHLSPATKFYDPALYLPDYDFMTPDPLQDCVDLITAFQREGFEEVEAKLGIHEGTYKIFVNYRPAADITYMPESLYNATVADSPVIGGIRYASPDFLRMNMYLELSRPAGNVSRWEKVYERLLLLNNEKPIHAGNCRPSRRQSRSQSKQSKILDIGIDHKAIFLSGASLHLDPDHPKSVDVVLMIVEDRHKITEALEKLPLKAERHEALGELLPARTEFRTKKHKLKAVVFDTAGCHAYVKMDSYRQGMLLGSLDLMIHMYYGIHFAGLKEYLPGRMMCVIHDLIELEAEKRRAAIQEDGAESVFPLVCIGHQPTMPELKRAHRKRIVEKQAELTRLSRKRKGKQQGDHLRQK